MFNMLFNITQHDNMNFYVINFNMVNALVESVVESVVYALILSASLKWFYVVESLLMSVIFVCLYCMSFLCVFMCFIFVTKKKVK